MDNILTINSLRNREDVPYDLKAYIKPLATITDFEAIIQQQNFKGIDRKSFDKTVEELDIQESLVELIRCK